jgi:hypothetical protein
MDHVLLQRPLRSHRRRSILLAARFFDGLEAGPNVFWNRPPAYLNGK